MTLSTLADLIIVSTFFLIAGIGFGYMISEILTLIGTIIKKLYAKYKEHKAKKQEKSE